METRHDEIAAALQLALLLEVSAYPKPGNIHRTRDFERTRFEHFLASASALGSQFRLAALRGHRFTESLGKVADLRIGDCIRRGVEACSEWQRGGNTSLGSILLLMPLAYASGMVSSRSDLKAQAIRKNVRKVVSRTTSTDAVQAYRAISQASPGGLGRTPELDVNDQRSIGEIRERNVSLLDVFRISALYDTVSREWVSNFPVTFDIGLPYLTRELQVTGDINDAVVDTYLRILSRVPDTLIARRHGMKTAREVSYEASQVLRAGGMKTARGRKAVENLDRGLQNADHTFNPGTTADLTASTLSVLILGGYRP